MPKSFSALTPPRMVRCTSSRTTDRSVPSPGRICLLCLTVHIFFAFFFVINELLFMPFSYSTDAATNLSRNDKRKHKQTEVTLFCLTAANENYTWMERLHVDGRPIVIIIIMMTITQAHG